MLGHRLATAPVPAAFDHPRDQMAAVWQLGESEHPAHGLAVSFNWESEGKSPPCIVLATGIEMACAVDPQAQNIAQA